MFAYKRDKLDGIAISLEEKADERYAVSFRLGDQQPHNTNIAWGGSS